MPRPTGSAVLPPDRAGLPRLADRLVRRVVPARVGWLDRGGGPDPLPENHRAGRTIHPAGPGATEIPGIPGRGAAVRRGGLPAHRCGPARPVHRRPADLPARGGHPRGRLGAGRVLGAGDRAAPAASAAHGTLLARIRHGQPRCLDRAAAARRPHQGAARRCRAGRLRHLVRRPAPHRDRRGGLVGPGLAAGAVRELPGRAPADPDAGRGRTGRHRRAGLRRATCECSTPGGCSPGSTPDCRRRCCPPTGRPGPRGNSSTGCGSAGRRPGCATSWPSPVGEPAGDAAGFRCRTAPG